MIFFSRGNGGLLAVAPTTFHHVHALFAYITNVLELQLSPVPAHMSEVPPGLCVGDHDPVYDGIEGAPAAHTHLFATAACLQSYVGYMCEENTLITCLRMWNSEMSISPRYDAVDCFSGTGQVSVTRHAGWLK